MAPFSIASIDCEDWLRAEVGAMSGVIAACIFGSALTVENPNDVDLCLVTDVRVGSDDWHRAREQRDSLADKFQKTFGLPLSAMLVTLSEWREVDGVVVRERCQLV